MSYRRIKLSVWIYINNTVVNWWYNVKPVPWSVNISSVIDVDESITSPK
jgi:hypothetical protein